MSKITLHPVADVSTVFPGQELTTVTYTCPCFVKVPHNVKDLMAEYQGVRACTSQSKFCWDLILSLILILGLARGSRKGSFSVACRPRWDMIRMTVTKPITPINTTIRNRFITALGSLRPLLPSRDLQNTSRLLSCENTENTL